MFPILDRTPTDCSVQWTVMNQFKDVKKQLASPGKETVITVDLGLYKPMQQLLMTNKEPDYILLPGDRHVMAHLRAISSFTDNEWTSSVED